MQAIHPKLKKAFPHDIGFRNLTVLASADVGINSLHNLQNNSSIACSRFFTPTTLIPNSFSNPFLFDSGRINFLKPRVWASLGVINRSGYALISHTMKKATAAGVRPIRVVWMAVRSEILKERKSGWIVNWI